MKVFKKQIDKEHWNILSYESNLDFFNLIYKKEYTLKTTLKEHHRSQVYQIEIGGKDYVLKIPLEKNTRKWIRFTTWFRNGEAFKNFKGMLTYKKAGINTTQPVMAAERRQAGMVTDSWLLYEYLDAESCLDKEEYYPHVVDTLSRIHQHGLLHGDPQVRNFMHCDNVIYVIDSNPKKSSSSFAQAYEFAYLRRSAPGIDKYFGDIQKSRVYKMARYYDTYERKFVRCRRKIKKQLRSQL